VRYSLELDERSKARAFAVRAVRIAPFSPASYRALLVALRTSAYRTSDRGIRDRRFLPVRPFQAGFQSHTGNIAPDRIECVPLVNKRGYALFGGDQLILVDGIYRAIFELRVVPLAFAQDPIVVLDVFENLQTMRVLSERAIAKADVFREDGLHTLEFRARAYQRVEFRVFWGEQCYLTIFGVLMEHLVRPSEGGGAQGSSTVDLWTLS